VQFTNLTIPLGGIIMRHVCRKDGWWLGGDTYVWVAFKCHCISDASASPTSHHSS